MHKGFCLALVLALAAVSTVLSEEPVEKDYLMTSSTTQYGWSTIDLTDGYLSDLPYSGFGLNYSGISRKFLHPDNQRLSVRTDFSINGGAVSNAPQTAFISYLGGTMGYGMQVHFKPLPNLQVLVGGTGEADMGVKMYSRDVNNAFNMDLALNLNLAATLRYDLTLWNKPLRLQADLRSPLLGLMFVPVRGESYSEIFYLGSSENLFHVTSLHNKNGLNIRYLVQMPLKRSVLNIGFQTDYLSYEANGMFFRRNITSMSVGTTFDLVTFGGRTNKAPAHFLSAEW